MLRFSCKVAELHNGGANALTGAGTAPKNEHNGPQGWLVENPFYCSFNWLCCPLAKKKKRKEIYVTNISCTLTKQQMGPKNGDN